MLFHFLQSYKCNGKISVFVLVAFFCVEILYSFQFLRLLNVLSIKYDFAVITWFFKGRMNINLLCCANLLICE